MINNGVFVSNIVIFCDTPFLQKKPTYLKSVVFFDQPHRYLFFDHSSYIFFIFHIVFPNFFSTNIMLIWFIVDNSLAIGNPYAVTVDKYSGTNVFL